MEADQKRGLRVSITLAEAALVYVERLRLPVFPVREGGKAPATKHGFKDATLDTSIIRRWWAEHPNCNIGLPIPPGFVVLDVDSDFALHALAAHDLDIPATVNAKTPRGYHFWFRCDRSVQPRVGIFPGVDLRAPGSYVVAPPSRLSDGATYHWRGKPRREGDYTEAPDWLLELAKQPVFVDGAEESKPSIKPAEVLAGVAEGYRDVTLFRYACRLRGLGYDRSEAEVLVAHAASSSRPPMPSSVATQKVASAWKYEGPKQKNPDEGRIWELRDLLDTTFEEPFWLIRELLPEGLTIVFSPAKVGKSFLLGAACYAVATGGIFISRYPTTRCGVLYLDLEQSERMAQKRWFSVLAGRVKPSLLYTAFTWPRMDQGGLDKIDRYLTENPQTRLVVADVLSMLWPERKASDGGNAYHWEYRVLSDLRTLAQKHGAAIVLVHHTNRSTPSDPLDRANGTQAMTGVPDVVWVLSRQRNGSDGELYLTGKNVEEQKVEMMFAPRLGGWQALEARLDEMPDPAAAVEETFA